MDPRHWAFAFFTVAAVAACAGGNSGAPSAGMLPQGLATKGGSTPIAHVVIVIQENRSFDNLFATFPGADGTTSGAAAAMPAPIASACAAEGQPVITKAGSVRLTKVSLIGAGFPGNFGQGNDLSHVYSGYQTDYDGGPMDGFDLTRFGPDGSSNEATCTYTYQYVDPKEIRPYWDMAQQYVLADHTFQTQGSGTFTAHQDLIAGATAVSYGSDQASVIDNPTWFPWGCDAKSSTITSLLTTSGKYLRDKGPWPCFSYETMRDLLDAKSVSWKYYAQKVQGPNGPQHGDTAGIWSAFDAIQAVRNDPNEWGKNVTFSDLQIFKDVSNGHLPAVSWITPDAQNSDHPQEHVHGKLVDDGPAWVASIVNAIGQSKYWKSTAIVILWDDWGGFYDHEPPPFFDNQGGLGFRVPMLIISPYVQAHVEHTQYEYGSILKFIEQNWNLGSLGTTDQRATSISNAFNFAQAPRPFQVIPSDRSRSFFLNQKPSGIAPDSE
ncbi:MAG: alkaline phosphatase family protein [Candidatus Baltobacteraceae bacterium]